MRAVTRGPAFIEPGLWVADAMAARAQMKKARAVKKTVAKKRATSRRRAKAATTAMTATADATPATAAIGNRDNVVVRTADGIFELENTWLKRAPAGSDSVEENRKPATETSSRNRLARAAMQWTYVVRSRQRWTSTAESIKRQAQAAQEFVQWLGLDYVKLSRIAQAGLAEVSIDWSGKESVDWPARILPWEYVLAAATKSIRGERTLTVIRHLRGAPTPPPAPPPQRILYVESTPGLLQQLYQTPTRKTLVRSMLRRLAWHELVNPTAKELQAEIQRTRPDIVHLAGFDTHRARALLLQAGATEAAARLEAEVAKDKGSDELQDGFVFSDIAGQAEPVTAGRLADLLTGAHRPRLVTLDFDNSAARVAPLAVARGVVAAIGFQDSFSGEQAEQFYSVLYTRINRSESLHEAFQSAWERLHGEPGQRHGTGLVLWSATSAFADTAVAAARRRGQSQRHKHRLETEEARRIDVRTVQPGRDDTYIHVDVVELKDLNYAMLHNRQPLFERFAIRTLVPGTYRNVHVKVVLSTGTESASFEKTVTVVHPSFDLNPHVHVPLTSEITRSVHESVQTSLFVEVTWGEHVLYRDTKRVRLTPVDQWRDSDNDRKWLPSFIFPRDLAVGRLVDTAQRYVRVLRDNPIAGFDGYQSFDIKHPDTAAEIDLQVQAMWSAIVHEMGLGYINPPPGYSNELDCQRLRTPTMIARDHSGTCIDLALFFAACLELVDIYPVVFLLEGHAFPGYWRASDYHDAFVEARPEGIQEIVRADQNASAIAGSQAAPWLLGKGTYREIVQLVNDGRLVPLETVRLTEMGSFADAIEGGRENLKVQREFEAMIDVAIAREKQVTPLPILGEQS